ncbi:unnamed protein product [Rotaria magnacalcarata]|uniref:HAT C-terminal dimerisation domain-containing protein n=1 Tax=Rotaria magnacalcarata TaxID=392030 RepID=A0A815TAS1_9BILA|nr:unnamed protein product [Rotaria magnacalcarata]
MPAENRDVYSGSNHLPPRPQTRSNSLRTRPSRSSTDNHILHRTLASRSPSSSSIIRRRRESSIQQNDRLKKSAYSSIINTNSRSSSGLTSINNSRYVDSLHNNEDDDECDMRSDTVSVIELNNQNRLVNENINSNKLPFEIDEHTTQKKTTTASGKKLSTEVYQLFEKQSEGMYKCTLCINELKPPDRGTLSLRLHNQYHHHILDLKSVLPHIGPIAFTSDLWKDVRWNSTFKMIDRLLNLRSLVDEIFAKRDFNGLTSAQETKLRSIMFTYDDWELLTALHDCLSPFDKATTILSGDYPTQSMSYFVLQTLKENVQQKFNPTYYHTIINKSLNFQSEYYLDDFLPGAQKLAMKVAAFLDPLFHGDLILYKEDYEAAKQLLTQNMQQMDLTSPDTSTIFSSSTSQALSSTTNSDRMMSFKSSLMNVTRKKASPPLSFQPVSVDLEMAIFLNLIRDNESMDFQMFWKNNARALPRLNQLARRYNIIPATSVYLEQQFSVAGAIKNIRRASMSSLSLRSLIILKKKDKIEKIRLFAHKQ